MRPIIITATGTDIGKTKVTQYMISALLAQGRAVCAYKPVATGAVDGLSEDTAAILAAQYGSNWRARPDAAQLMHKCTPFALQDPLSPDIAAHMAGVDLQARHVTEYLAAQLDEHRREVVLIEGIGGVMVPIDERSTFLDIASILAAEHGARTILICGHYLGSISHSLTAIRVMEAAGCSPSAIIINDHAQQLHMPPEETARSIANYTSAPVHILRREVAEDDMAHNMMVIRDIIGQLTIPTVRRRHVRG